MGEVLDLLLACAPFGHVADGRSHETALLGVDGADADADRKLAPRLRDGPQIAILVALAQVGGRGRLQRELQAAIAFREQHVDRLAQKFLLTVAEHQFGLSIDDRDEFLGVGNDERIG